MQTNVRTITCFILQSCSSQCIISVLVLAAQESELKEIRRRIRELEEILIVDFPSALPTGYRGG